MYIVQEKCQLFEDLKGNNKIWEVTVSLSAVYLYLNIWRPLFKGFSRFGPSLTCAEVKGRLLTTQLCDYTTFSYETLGSKTIWWMFKFSLTVAKLLKQLHFLSPHRKMSVSLLQNEENAYQVIPSLISLDVRRSRPYLACRDY